MFCNINIYFFEQFCTLICLISHLFMPVEIKRKANESTYSLLTRFKDKVKKGRVLALAKKGMYWQKKKSKHQIKKDALRREYNRARRKYLIKVGKIDEDMIGQGNNKKYGKKK